MLREHAACERNGIYGKYLWRWNQLRRERRKCRNDKAINLEETSDLMWIALEYFSPSENLFFPKRHLLLINIPYDCLGSDLIGWFIIYATLLREISSKLICDNLLVRDSRQLFISANKAKFRDNLGSDAINLSCHIPNILFNVTRNPLVLWIDINFTKSARKPLINRQARGQVEERHRLNSMSHPHKSRSQVAWHENLNDQERAEKPFVRIICRRLT